MKTCLITGASSGIGLELAQVFGRNGYNLVLISRDEKSLKNVGENLKDTYKIMVDCIVKDLTQHNSPQEIYSELQERNISVDIVVNNAGQGEFGDFAAIPLERERELVNVNISALVSLTNLFLKDMLERKSGKILNLGSVAGFFPGPRLAVYHATKAFVISFSRSLSEELVGTGVTVSCLCPGLTYTPFFRTAHMDHLQIISRMNPAMMNARRVAEVGYAGLMKGKKIIVPGLMNKLFVFSKRFLPTTFIFRIIYKRI